MKIAVSGRRSKYWLKQNPVETINYFNSVLFGELAGRILTEGKKKSQDINEAWGFGLKEIELISGMAEGIDLLWAQLGIVLGLKVYCYLPCIDQYTLMNDYWSSIWFNILENQNNNVEKVYCYTKEYKLNPSCLNQRNIKRNTQTGNL